MGPLCHSDCDVQKFEGAVDAELCGRRHNFCGDMRRVDPDETFAKN